MANNTIEISKIDFIETSIDDSELHVFLLGQEKPLVFKSECSVVFNKDGKTILILKLY